MQHFATLSEISIYLYMTPTVRIGLYFLTQSVSVNPSYPWLLLPLDESLAWFYISCRQYEQYPKSVYGLRCACRRACGVRRTDSSSRSAAIVCSCIWRRNCSFWWHVCWSLSHCVGDGQYFNVPVWYGRHKCDPFQGMFTSLILLTWSLVFFDLDFYFIL